MKIIIQNTKMNLSAEQKMYIEKKFDLFGKLIKRYERAGEINLYIEVAESTKHHKQGNIFYSEATLHLPHKTLRAEHYDKNIVASVDSLKDKLRTEIVKYRGKKISERKK